MAHSRIEIYFDNIPVSTGLYYQSPSTVDEGDDYESFKTALKTRFSGDNEGLVRKCFYENVKSCYPYEAYYARDNVEYYYRILGEEISEETPVELREEILTTFLKQTDIYKYTDWSSSRSLMIINLSINVLILQVRLLPENIKKTFLDRIADNPIANILCQENFHPLWMDKWLCNSIFPEKLPEIFLLFTESSQLKCISNLLKCMRIGDKPYQLLCQIRDKLSYPKFEELLQIILLADPELNKELNICGYLTKLDLAFHKFNQAQKYYPSLLTDQVNTCLAFDLYSQIPSWSKEFYEAQLWMAIIICHHSNFTPEDFATEEDEEKAARLMAMKPYLDAAASGNEIATLQKQSLDNDLEKLKSRIPSSFVFFQPDSGIKNTDDKEPGMIKFLKQAN